MEVLGDVRFGQVHDRRNDVVGRFATELADELAEIGLHGVDAFRFQRFVEVDFLGCHRFGFYDLADVAMASQIQDPPARLLTGLSPENRAAVLENVAFELLQVTIEVIDGFPFDLRRDETGVLPVGKTLFAFDDCGFVGVDGPLNDGAET